MTAPPDRASPRARPATTIAIVRAWVEGDAPADLRIRIVSVPVDAGETADIGVATSIGEACELVRAWLERFSAAHRQSLD